MHGSDEIVPTRPKRKSSPKGAGQPAKRDQAEDLAAGDLSCKADTVSALKTLASATEIAGHIGRESSIDGDVYASCEPDIAREIIALARYTHVHRKFNIQSTYYGLQCH